MRKLPSLLLALLVVAVSGVTHRTASPAQAPAQRRTAAEASLSVLSSDRPTTVVNPRQQDVTYTDYTFRDGETLARLRLHYALLGTPHVNRHGTVDNAVLLLHWTGAAGQNLLTPEFQDALFAPGAPFDITRYFVIIPDAVGHGGSSKPSDGLRAGFPHYGYQDMVDLQHKLVTETLGIPHLRAVVGMSMGCMNAWQWAEAYPDAMDGIMPVACFPAPVSGRNLLWRRVIIDGVKSDPAYENGNYRQQPPSAAVAFNVAQMMINGVPNLQAQITSPQAADQYIQAVKSQTAGQDANDLLYAFEASADFDAEPRLGDIRAKVFALNFADDEFYPDSLRILERDSAEVRNAKVVIRPASADSVGHLSMSRPGLWKDQAARFLLWLNTA
ncbi:alpha/beta fold hydrolase [Streptomyces liangshanensis]|uniref:Alpha/beta fold hydrolase n=1 Tax=Streptomyces liangshanensis TaxID=2717324 RepID=A0A6G9H682_9ACTN|nr:alpha/beta fold hydrolase [Streptomyces liangshanensis]QIQ06052.1 alpha/beta fold hydrolase [Streptomyces liangshanensis]